MPFLLLLLFSVVIVFDPWPTPFWNGEFDGNVWWSVTATALAVFTILASAAAMSRWAQRSMRAYPVLRLSIRHRYSSLRRFHFLAMLATYGLLLFVLGWGWAVQRISKDEPWLTGATDLFLLLPFIVMLVGSWACLYGGEKALREVYLDPTGRYWTRWEYVDFHLRQNLALVAAPLALMVLLKFLYRVTPDKNLLALLSAAVIALVFIGQPWILRLMLRLKPLPEGELRERLVSTSKRLGFRCGNILVWNTNGGVLNAMVAGLLPYPRFVMLTDRLLTELTPDEIEAVFGHELGHIKHGHIPFYAAFLVGCVVAFALLAGLLISAVPALQSASEAHPLAVAAMLQFFLLGSVFLMFGFLSRRCERQADVFGCRAVSCGQPDCPEHTAETNLAPAGRGLCGTGIGIFIDALEKVAVLNGICRSRPGWLQSWRHSTIARRVEFLHRLRANPHVEVQFQRTVGRIKWALVCGLLVVLLILASVHWGGEWAEAWQVLANVSTN